METKKNLISLSIDAIKYGALLSTIDTGELSRSLYYYNTAPIPIQHCNTQWDHHSIFSQGRPAKKNSELLENTWTPLTDDKPNRYWLSWGSKKETINVISPVQCTYKLYISPVVADFFPVFSETINALNTGNAFCFKTGNNYHGISRPDKIVVYFENFESLTETAEKIYKACISFSAQGVPFTAPLFDTRMLSWGIDPPSLNDNDAVSWRVWITRELAKGIIESKKNLSGEPWNAALKYIQRKGFDIETWKPDKTLFTQQQ